MMTTPQTVGDRAVPGSGSDELVDIGRRHGFVARYPPSENPVSPEGVTGRSSLS